MSHEYKIEKDVPVTGERKNKSKYPLAEMTVGDSFLIPLEGVKYTSVRQGVYLAAKKLGVPITTRRKQEGLRVWRKE